DGMELTSGRWRVARVGRVGLVVDLPDHPVGLGSIVAQIAYLGVDHAHAGLIWLLRAAVHVARSWSGGRPALGQHRANRDVRATPAAVGRHGRVAIGRADRGGPAGDFGILEDQVAGVGAQPDSARAIAPHAQPAP